MTAHRTRRNVSLLCVLTLLATIGSAGTAQAEPVPLYGEPGVTDAGEFVYDTRRIGPITLGAMGEPNWDRNMGGSVPTALSDDPAKPWLAIRGITFDLVDEHGTSLRNDEVHLHHIALFTPGQHDPACPSRGFGRLHLAAGAERTPIAVPDPYAIRKPNSENWFANWHLMNLEDTARDVYIEYTIAHQPGRTEEGTRWLEPWFLEVSGECGNATYDVPGDGGPDSVHVQSRTWTMPDDGVIVGTGGHLHDGGIATELRNGDDALICRSEVDYLGDHEHDGGHGHAGEHAHGTQIERISPCAVHWRFDAGEQITLDALYENHQPVAGAMGINVTFIWFGDQGDGIDAFPDVDESHPFFREIAWGRDAGLARGYDDGLFHPTSPVSRQAYVAFLHRLLTDAHSHDACGPLHDPHDHGGHGHACHHQVDTGFSDVPPGHPFAHEIAWAVEHGLVTGYHDGTFRPDQPMSRQAMVAVLHRHAGGEHDDHGHGHGAAGTFSDVYGDNPFAGAIEWAAGAGLVTGYDDGTFRPLDDVSRQATIAVLSRYEAQRYADQLWALFVETFNWAA